ncbi:hypothetical protein HaLaN_09261 [Haematococcus lacustris]|uniref:Uncharacterized protein n=1 Tax=Haematococcus lacustris TaxID=44745 RepID=A0A699YW11_HAELA|nr:hypothetical protein HaLaN_09261 [Haematococcus lacustris]
MDGWQMAHRCIEKVLICSVTARRPRSGQGGCKLCAWGAEDLQGPCSEALSARDGCCKCDRVSPADLGAIEAAWMLRY